MTRFLLYSHDTYGLGHFRRSGLLASAIVGTDVDNDVLVVTGSPWAQTFALPDRVDLLTLPTATKDTAGAYRPRRLACGLERLVRLRSGLLQSAAAGYEPDVILVDHAPLGMAGELVPLLESLDAASRRTRLVLGMRDIVDDVQRVDTEWQRDDVWTWLDRYDDIFVYGDSRIRTTAIELNLATRTSARVSHTGFVAPTMPDPMTDEPFLLVTAGGGGDGQVMLRRYLDAVESGASADVRSIVVTGPLLSAGRRAELLVRAERLPSVHLVESSDRMRSLIASAMGVISMAGYNTVVEELASNVPALLVPRRTPRLEQDIRARRLAPHSRLEHCPVDELTTQRVEQFVTGCIERRHAGHMRNDWLNLSGASTVAAALGPAPVTSPHRQAARV